ncbi:MAG TPA: hypothetical protein VKS82_15080 [Streptosporangiaceae bacterium]|jgi:hypothetical protein|nr:hypothetical protein [Streptosporangiaceae bacterium]
MLPARERDGRIAPWRRGYDGRRRYAQDFTIFGGSLGEAQRKHGNPPM